MCEKRLEKIEKDKAMSNDDVVIKEDDYNWLIEQAEKVEKLEDNAKFKHEIEYLKGSNELLQEDNVKFQDALWHYHDMKMKEGAE